MKCLITVTGKCKRCQAAFPGIDAKFFFELANEGCFRRFAGFNLAARKLPQPGHGFTFGALRKQNAPIRVNQGYGRDQDNLHER